MNHKNNPAGRMFLLLQELKDKGAPWARVLAKHLGFKTNEHLVLKAVGPFLALPAAIRKHILELDVDHNMYLRHLKEIEARLMSTPPGQGAKALVDGFSAAAIQSLEFCSEALSRLRPERLFEDEELSRLHKEIATLADEISTSEIAPDLKAFMIDKLTLLLDAIRLYAVSGAGLLTQAVESLVGSYRI